MTPSVVPLPSRGDVFLDGRGSDRGMRVSWHHEQGVVVVSLWRADTCIGTLQLPREEVPRLIVALAGGLADAEAAEAEAADAEAADAASPRRAS
jgi:hypothetical protein